MPPPPLKNNLVFCILQIYQKLLNFVGGAIQKQYITQIFTVNPDKIRENEKAFLQAVDDNKKH